MPELRVFGNPQMNMLSFAFDEVSVFHVADEMRERGSDLRECVAAARKLPSGALAARIREACSGLEAADVTPELFDGLLAMAGLKGSALPRRMAEINEVLNALPVPLRERLLVEYLNDPYRPT